MARYTPPKDEERLLLDDPVIESMVKRHIELGKIEKEAEEEKEALKVQIVEYLSGAKKATGKNWTVTLSYIPEKPEELITAEMVGKVFKSARKAQLRCLVKGK